MMRTQELRNYNEEIHRTLKSKYPTLQLGFFKNNALMFIGQNPGNPYSSTTKYFTQTTLQSETFSEFESKYFEMIKDSKIGTVLKSLLTEEFRHISFTNIVKIPTEDNSEPSQELLDEFFPITQKQISLLSPTLIILLGKFVGKQFGITEFHKLTKIDTQYYIMIEHPSYLLRFEDIQSYADKINHLRILLNDILKKIAIVKVTNYQVIYRDLEFKKCVYEHNQKADYCYVETERESQYKSFDGRNLAKANKQMAIDASSYEKHLWGKDHFYYNNIDSISHSKMVRVALFDIENDFCNDVLNPTKPITSIISYDNFENKYFGWALKNTPDQKIAYERDDLILKEFEDEKTMLINFFEYLKLVDVICGWYSNSFDAPYLLNRAKILGIDLEKYFKSLNLKINEFKEIRIYQQSHIFHDALEFYKRNTYYNKPPSFSLGVVSSFLFGDKYNKSAKSSDVGEMWRNDIDKLIEYNLNDVVLLKMIVDSNNIINYPLQLQQICPQDFENVFFNSFTIENLLHHRYWKKNIFFPTKIEHIKPSYEGASVLTPVPGLHHNTAVYDFSAMYTSIFLSLNFSPDTFIGDKNDIERRFEEVKIDLIKRYNLKDKFESLTKEEVLKQWILVKTDLGEHYFLPQDWKIGIIPALEKEMLDYRKIYTSQRDKYDSKSVEYKIYDELQGQAKTILNSCYGIVAFKKFILFNPKVPASITSIGRQLNALVQNLAREHNLLPLYSDTDSCFIEFDKSLSFTDFKLKAEEFENIINSSFQTFTKQFTVNDFVINNSKYKIEFEKAYSRLLLTDVKKRYVGYLKLYKGKILEEEKMSITGFEVRQDSCPVAFKRILTNIYKLLLEDDHTKKIREYYKKISKELKTYPLEDFIIKIKLSRDMNSYENLPIHVRALKNSKSEIKRGEHVNMLYVKDSREVLHYDEFSKQEFVLDYDKYLENFLLNKIKLIDKSFDINPTLQEYWI